MSAHLSQQNAHDRLVNWLARASLLPAVAAALVSCMAYVEYFAHLGTTPSRVLAVAVSAAIGGSYLACCHMLLKGAAKLEPQSRAALTPVIVAIWLVISFASAFPILINAGKGLASEAAGNRYIAQAERATDQLKGAVLAFGQIKAVLETEAQRFDAQSSMEGGGVYSGTATEGPVARWLAGFAARLRDAQEIVSRASEEAEDHVRVIDKSLDRLRKATIDTELDLQTRRAAQRKAGDELRTAFVALQESVPLPALETLSSSLQGPQSAPALSANPAIRQQQQDAVRRMEDELRRVGRDLDRRLEPMAEAVKSKIPYYAVVSDAELVLTHWFAVPHVAAMSFGLDALPFAIYLIVARIYDADRINAARHAAGAGPSQRPPNAPLGPHPHPAATRARGLHKHDDSAE